MAPKSRISLVVFLATALCFLLPFVTVSCGGQKVTSFSGIQLATGTTVQQPQPFGPPHQQKVDPDPAAALAALCALLGIALSFVPAKNALAPASAAVVGALALLVVKSRLDDQVVQQGHGMLQVNYEFGFSLTLLFFVVAAVWNVYFFSQRTRPPMATQVPSYQVGMRNNSDKPQEHSAFPTCPHCGKPRAPDALLCANCGKAVSDAGLHV